MQKAADRKIAIIGAGPSGLAAAEALREKGYRDITVFDKNDRAGGQSLSCEYITPDKRKLVYDLGSVQPLGSKILSRLFKTYGLHFGRGPLENKYRVIYAFSYKRNKEFVNYLRHYLGVPFRQVPGLLADVAKLSYYLWRYRRLAKPGFYNFKYWDETTVSIKEWVEARKFNVLGDKLLALMYNLMTLSNKANEEKVRMYTVFKFLYQMLKPPMRYIDGTYRPVKEGYQELWNKIAGNFNMKLGTDIQSITRGADGIRIQTSGSSGLFDELIISCPFDRIAPALDIRPAEAGLFRNIYYNPGYRGAFVAKNGPTDRVCWYPDSYDSGSEPPFLALAIPEGMVDEVHCLYSCVFSHCDDTGNAVQILQNSAEQVFRDYEKAEITAWVQMKYWQDYGCFFEDDVVKDGVYDKIQALQGTDHTYYTGQLISFSAHSSVVDYSYELMDLFF
ncbi:MAG TPA: NAD(P)-binding protein [Bacteroidia bacterium]|jgi:oxygen-dependent protoporphyrinogen oxidase|nr:NAD(P)-binding protein [Bacteroidia bacterium]